MKWLFLIVFISAGSGVYAQASAPMIESDADKSAALIKHVHQTGLAQRLQTIIWDSVHIEKAIAKMKEMGEITSPEMEHQIRAQLALGLIFAREGILHESVYLALSQRYGNSREMANAMRNFKNISAAEEKGVLLSEIIERALQFLPDVDSANVHRLKDLAAYINTSEDQLIHLRDQWMIYDQDDRFVEMMQGGVLALLISADDKFVADVLARGSLKYRIRRHFSKINLPARPPINPDLSRREVEILNREYFESSSLESYLTQSSSAALRFFLTDQLHYLTLSQLRFVQAKKTDLWLKPSVLQALDQEVNWRIQLVRKQSVIQSLEQDSHELRTAIRRLQNQETYDRPQLQKRVNSLRSLSDLASVQAEASAIIREYAEVCDSPQFVNMISSVMTAAVARLREQTMAAAGVLEVAVLAANAVGLQEAHAHKVKQLLTDLAARLPDNGSVKANAIIARLVTRQSKYAHLGLSQLTATQAQVEQAMELANHELNQLYEKGP